MINRYDKHDKIEIFLANDYAFSYKMRKLFWNFSAINYLLEELLSFWFKLKFNSHNLPKTLQNYKNRNKIKLGQRFYIICYVFVI